MQKPRLQTDLSFYNDQGQSFLFRRYAMHNSEAITDAQIEYILHLYKTDFGVYSNNSFVGPFGEDAYVLKNYSETNAAQNEVENFLQSVYRFLPERPKEFNPLNPFELLKTVVHEMVQNQGRFFLFQFNYGNISDTKNWPWEAFQFDAFFSFFHIEDEFFSIGRCFSN